MTLAGSQGAHFGSATTDRSAARRLSRKAPKTRKRRDHLEMHFFGVEMKGRLPRPMAHKI